MSGTCRHCHDSMMHRGVRSLICTEQLSASIGSALEASSSSFKDLVPKPCKIRMGMHLGPRFISSPRPLSICTCAGTGWAMGVRQRQPAIPLIPAAAVPPLRQPGGHVLRDRGACIAHAAHDGLLPCPGAPVPHLRNHCYAQVKIRCRAEG